MAPYAATSERMDADLATTNLFLGVIAAVSALEALTLIAIIVGVFVLHSSNDAAHRFSRGWNRDCPCSRTGLFDSRRHQGDDGEGEERRRVDSQTHRAHLSQVRTMPETRVIYQVLARGRRCWLFRVTRNGCGARSRCNLRDPPPGGLHDTEISNPCWQRVLSPRSALPCRQTKARA